MIRLIAAGVVLLLGNIAASADSLHASENPSLETLQQVSQSLMRLDSASDSDFVTGVANRILRSDALPATARQQREAALSMILRVQQWRWFKQSPGRLDDGHRTLALYRMASNSFPSSDPPTDTTLHLRGEFEQLLDVLGVDGLEDNRYVTEFNVMPRNIAHELAEVLYSFRLFYKASVVATPSILAWPGFHLPNAVRDFWKPPTLIDGNPGARQIGSPQNSPSWSDLGRFLGGVVAARERLVRSSVALASALRSASAAWRRSWNPIDVPGVVRIDLSDTDNSYLEDYVLIVDGGGDDVYKNNAGGAWGGGVDILECAPHGRVTGTAASAVIDLTGDDRYVSARDCGVNGGGVLASGFLFDGEGNDRYIGGSGAVNGSGFLGTGAIIDGGGSDEFRAKGIATNGTGFYGTGLILSQAGNDLYVNDDPSGQFSNGSACLGEGLIVDGGGIDSFIGTRDGNAVTGACGLSASAGIVELGDSMRFESSFGNSFAALGGTSLIVNLGSSSTIYAGGAQGPAHNSRAVLGGVSLLYDESGDDEYAGDSNGVAGGGAIALLLDPSGADSFDVGGNASGGDGGVGVQITGSGDTVRTGDNGVGFGGGAGFLVDRTGNDLYRAGGQVANGAGTVGGTGFLLDLAGNDRYESKTYGNASAVANGAGACAGTGFLRDTAGDDLYVASAGAGNGAGIACFPYEGPTAGMLRDDGGDDSYIVRAGNGGFVGFGAGVAILLDGGGHDYYRDEALPEDQRECWDCTIFLKGIVGVQVDA